MYSLRLTCPPDEAEILAADLWEAGTTGIHELGGSGTAILIASFETNACRSELLERFAPFSPDWQVADPTDWVAHTHRAWPARSIGKRLFLAPPWSEDETPPTRLRITHNPGLACGTGEHPCTQLALMALEEHGTPGIRLVDIGTGSGILAIAALHLGARTAIGLDIDEAAIQAALENFSLNQLKPALVAGSSNCLPDGCADLTIANINGAVLLSIMNDLLRITRPGGRLIVTGFTDSELPAFQDLLGNSHITAAGAWRCATFTV